MLNLFIVVKWKHLSIGVFDEKKSSPREQLINVPIIRDAPSNTEPFNRRSRLRRKSLSFTDAFTSYGMKKAEKNVISRTYVLFIMLHIEYWDFFYLAKTVSLYFIGNS